jgi:hypothetical protein
LHITDQFPAAKTLADQSEAQAALDSLVIAIAHEHDLGVHCHAAVLVPSKPIDPQAAKLSVVRSTAPTWVLISHGAVLA